LELEFNDTKIKLSKKAGLETTGNNQGTIIQIGQTSGAMSMPAAQPMMAAPAPSTAAPATVSAPAIAVSNSHEVKSPIVGTFYRSPSPDSDPFVEVGTRVSIGQTLCIIEAMKLMNEIECDVNGVVEQVLLTNGTPVEYNQVLFKIKAD
jgi:acetyl-CoA carboxylase biotin carboxyl carrier protein